MEKNTKKEEKKSEEVVDSKITALAQGQTTKKTSSKKSAKDNKNAIETPKLKEKKNPSDVEIVETEEISDFYDIVSFNWEGTSYNTTLSKKYSIKKKYEIPNHKHVKAFIPGTIQKVYVADGDKVKFNDKLLVLEAMKMKNNLLAPFAGVIKKVYVKQGAQVAKNEILVEFK